MTVLDEVTAVTLALRPARRPWQRRDFLRFLLFKEDQDRITGAIQTQDVNYGNSPVAGAPYPQALELSITVGNPADGPPQLRPLFPGRLTFMVDTPATIPQPADVSRTNYPGWTTLGTLMIEMVDPDLNKAFAAFTPGLAVRPNVMWYSKVRITEAFLFETLPRIARSDVPLDRAGNPTPAARQKIRDFLNGTFRPILSINKEQRKKAKDDPVRVRAMPTLDMNTTTGSTSLRVTAALRQDPKDGPASKLDEVMPAGTSVNDPAHPRNGAIPARLVYRAAADAGHLIDATATDELAQATIPAAATVRYFPLPFTRIWTPEAECSIHFPRQVVVVEREANPRTPFTRQRLASHGFFYLALSAAQEAQGRQFAVSIQSPANDTEEQMWLLDGAGDNWRRQARPDAVVYDLSLIASPHIVLRRRMQAEMLIEPRDQVAGPSCTYFSMRRSVRALVNNRITGGRLNFGRDSTSSPTQKLIDDAWKGIGRFSEARVEFAAAKGRPLVAVKRSDLIAYNEPLPEYAPVRSVWLRPILHAFFPHDAPAQTITNSQWRRRVFSVGEVAWYLWQSRLDRIQQNGTKRNFANAHIGRGGAGALVVTGLGTFRVDPSRMQNPPEQNVAYFNRIVAEMLVGIEPGAVVQFWNLETDFEAIKSRSVAGDELPVPVNTHYGHSPIIVRYDPQVNPTAITIIDQTGELNCPRVQAGDGSNRLQWGGFEQIWIAANWIE